MIRKKIIMVSIAITLSVSLYIFFYHNQYTNIIIEHNDVHIIEQYVSEDPSHNRRIAVIFDIDNTLVEPPSALGSDQWFYGMVAHLEQHGYAHQKAIDLTVPLYQKIMNLTSLQLTQPEIPYFLKNLAQKNVFILALTARSITLADRTITQLRERDIDFCQLNHNPESFFLKHDALFKGGILFVGTQNKGEILLAFFDRIAYYPTKIIAIDDKMKNIRNIQDPVVRKGIHFIGIRYNRLDEKVKAFTFEDTWYDLHQFYQQYHLPQETIMQFAP